MSDAKPQVATISESATPTVHDEPGVSAPIDANGLAISSPVADAPRNEKSSKDMDQDSQTNSDVLIVNWDGPDDPQNPKKYVIAAVFRFYPSSPLSRERRSFSDVISVQARVLTPILFQLVKEEEMGRYRHCLGLHLH